MNGHHATDSDTSAEFDEGISSPFERMSTGDDIAEAEIVDEEPPPKQERARRASQETPRATRTARDAKAGSPSLDEWLGFFSKVVLRLVVNWYLNYAFRDIDEDALSEREIERLAMTDEERQTIAVPFAELSHKSKFMRKHGRMIVASGDAFNSIVVLTTWMSRVNRIAAKHRPKVVKGRVNGSSGQSTPQGSGTAYGSTGGRFPDGFAGPIFGPGTG